MRYIRILFIITALLILPGTLLAQVQPLINSIEIQGLKRIEESSVKTKITQKAGEPLSQDKTNDDIKSIFKMGYFDDVKAEIESFEGGIKLIYFVKEKPTIVKIEFQGNKEFDDAKLKGYFAEIADIEKNYSALKATGHLTEESIIIFSSRLSDIKRYAMESLPKASKANKGNISELFICINDARQAISSDNSNNLKKTNSENLLNLFKNVTKR